MLGKTHHCLNLPFFSVGQASGGGVTGAWRLRRCGPSDRVENPTDPSSGASNERSAELFSAWGPTEKHTAMGSLLQESWPPKTWVGKVGKRRSPKSPSLNSRAPIYHYQPHGTATSKLLSGCYAHKFGAKSSESGHHSLTRSNGRDGSPCHFQKAELLVQIFQIQLVGQKKVWCAQFEILKVLNSTAASVGQVGDGRGCSPEIWRPQGCAVGFRRDFACLWGGILRMVRQPHRLSRGRRPRLSLNSKGDAPQMHQLSIPLVISGHLKLEINAPRFSNPLGLSLWTNFSWETARILIFPGPRATAGRAAIVASLGDGAKVGRRWDQRCFGRQTVEADYPGSFRGRNRNDRCTVTPAVMKFTGWVANNLWPYGKSQLKDEWKNKISISIPYSFIIPPRSCAVEVMFDGFFIMVTTCNDPHVWWDVGPL